MGGWSAEREISLVSGAAVAEALRTLGHEPIAIDVGRKVGQTLSGLKADVAFNALHGRFGEDGCIQGLLEIMSQPYTHSGVLASALAMDKPSSRALFAGAGLQCPEGCVAHRNEVIAGRVMDPPYVVKPVNEGSSVGVVIVAEGEDNPLESEAWHYGDRVLVERYVPGRELAVAVQGGEPLGVIEIVPSNRFYDYGAKYEAGGSTHTVPADLPKRTYDACMDIATRAHCVLGCRGITRSDFRYDVSQGEKDGVYLLEVNTQPGMTPTSLVPEIAAHGGVGFGDLVSWMVEDAGCRR